MSDLKLQPDDSLFDGKQEQPGSQRAYDRELEIKRREFVLAQSTAQAQKLAAEAQIQASVATISMAFWTRFSAIAVAITVVVTALGVWFDVFPRR